MKSRFFITAIFAVAAILATGCTDDKAFEEGNFELGSANPAFDAADMAITADPERQTITIAVETENPTNKWKAYCPTDDVWCSFSKRAGELVVTLDRNATDDPRSTHITVELGPTAKVIEVWQDYRRYIDFNIEGNTTVVGAAAGAISIPFNTNVKTAMTAAVASGVDWITDLTVQSNTLRFNIKKNYSLSDQRPALITVSGDDVQSGITVVQNALDGYNYRIDVSGLDFSESYVYEIWDDTHSIKVGEICREYIFDVDEQSSAVEVQMQSAVAYPCLKGQTTVDLQNGYILNDGGRVMWNSAATTGYEVLSKYIAGEFQQAPSVIFLPAGASIMTSDFTLEPGDEMFDTVLRPVIVTDTRTGAANTAGETTETWTYKVVKIGVQYWMAENLKTSRYRSGENIPTNISNDDWKTIAGVPIKPGCLTASASGASTRNIDANAPAAYDMRNEYGCLYNYAAIIGKEITAGQAAENWSDMISPQGWGVPSRDEFMLTVNYLLQGVTSAAQNSLDELSATATGTWANATGFTAKGNASRGVGTGGFNSGLYYITMDYVPGTGSSAFRYVRVNSGGNNVQGTHDAGVGDYIRCLRK